MTTYFIFAGDKQDDGTEHGYRDYIGSAEDFISAYHVVIFERSQREINYTHLAHVTKSSLTGKENLTFDYELVELTITKVDGLRENVVAWRQRAGNDLVIVEVRSGETLWTGKQPE